MKGKRQPNKGWGQPENIIRGRGETQGGKGRWQDGGIREREEGRGTGEVEEGKGGGGGREQGKGKLETKGGTDGQPSIQPLYTSHLATGLIPSQGSWDTLLSSSLLTYSPNSIIPHTSILHFSFVGSKSR